MDELVAMAQGAAQGGEGQCLCRRSAQAVEGRIGSPLAQVGVAQPIAHAVIRLLIQGYPQAQEGMSHPHEAGPVNELACGVIDEDVAAVEVAVVQAGWDRCSREFGAQRS